MQLERATFMQLLREKNPETKRLLVELMDGDIDKMDKRISDLHYKSFATLMIEKRIQMKQDRMEMKLQEMVQLTDKQLNDAKANTDYQFQQADMFMQAMMISMNTVIVEHNTLTEEVEKLNAKVKTLELNSVVDNLMGPAAVGEEVEVLPPASVMVGLTAELA
jgi:hypothetical protein